MFEPLKNPTYRNLFFAYLSATLGTGLTTVALALLAYDLAGPNAGLVLGTALTIKMITYVAVAPIAGAIANQFPRRRMLVALDLFRAGFVLFLPFVDALWQIYVLIFFIQSASAVFTPVFQATIPDILEDEDTYTKALSLTRLTYELENILSPMMATLLLAFVSFQQLFIGNTVGFIVSALLIMATKVPSARRSDKRDFLDRLTIGARIFISLDRLRGLLALNLAVAAGGSMVLVNTIVYVRGYLGLTETSLAIAMAAFGAGSMGGALAVPYLLRRYSERSIMIAGMIFTALGLGLGLFAPGLILFLVLWAFIGFCYSTTQTPIGRLLRKSGDLQDRPALFAAQFTFSHAGWLICYPLAGWLSASFGLSTAFVVLSGLCLAATLTAFALWRPDNA